MTKVFSTASAFEIQLTLQYAYNISSSEFNGYFYQSISVIEMSVYNLVPTSPTEQPTVIPTIDKNHNSTGYGDLYIPVRVIEGYFG